MKNVVFVAPFFLETTLRFVAAAASQRGARLYLVSQDPEEKLPPGLRRQLAGHYRIAQGVDRDAIGRGLEAIQSAVGPIHRLLGTLEELQVPLGELRDRMGIDGMGGAAAENFRDKARMKNVLREASLPCAQHRLVEDAATAMAFAGKVGYPLIVKPPAGSGAQGTSRVESDEQLQSCLQMMRPGPDRPLLLEEFVTGQEHSFDSVCRDGEILWSAVTEYFPTPLEVLEHPWIQWVVIAPREVDAPRFSEIHRVAPKALAALGMTTGLSHMEWFRRGDGSIALSEVGARPPGAQFTTLHSHASEFDLYSAWARLMIHDEFDAPPRRFAAGVAFLRGQGAGRVVAIHGLPEAGRQFGDIVVESNLPQEGSAHRSTYDGDGYVIVRHPETRVVEQALKKMIQMVRVELG